MYKTMDEDDDNRLDCDEVLVMVSAAMGTETGTDLADARRVLSAARDEFGMYNYMIDYMAIIHVIYSAVSFDFDLLSCPP